MKTLQEIIFESLLDKLNIKQTSSKNYEWYEKSGKFDPAELQWIEEGFKKGLTASQIERYAKPEYGSPKMYTIVHAMIDKLPEEWIDLMLKPELDYEQVSVIRTAYNRGISLEQIKALAIPKLKWDVMYGALYLYSKGITADQMKQIVKPGYSYIKIKKLAEKLVGPITFNAIISAKNEHTK